jgi:Protein of unknown function (DUF1592)/Protein of unknown function (DUF1588)/Protein of unknown function (DUF1585)/Protein of unknown function (DUF1587)/Protein of unknown function (DUF1595)/Planctomycete cytochrome C
MKKKLASQVLRFALMIGLIGAATGCSPHKQSAVAPGSAALAKDAALAQYHQQIEPILKNNCYDCHADGSSSGNVSFDTLTNASQILNNPELWLKVLKNTRAGLMPPPKKHPRLPADKQQVLDQWIEFAAFGVDPKNLDPGRVTVRRLNRSEYRNTIRDLMGFDFDTDTALPADAVGYGFDVIGDVQTMPPMLLEKYLEAARFIVSKAVPTTPRALGVQFAVGKEFLQTGTTNNGDPMSFYVEREVAHKFEARAPGDYRVIISTMVDGTTRRDEQHCNISVKADGQEFFQHEYVWFDCEFYTDERVLHWDKGNHDMTFALHPLVPDIKQTTKMDYKILTVQVLGPLNTNDWTHPPGYERFFTRDIPPSDPAERRAYAREVITSFATKAFRRPQSKETIETLVDIAENTYKAPGTTFESGVAGAMVAVLASPRFLFRVETAEPVAASQPFAAVDEYALASRLSYLLWSSMPDDELFKLASQGKLRQNLDAQVKRMFADPRAKAFVENFAGQWLQSRDVLNSAINRPEVLALEGKKTTEELTVAQRVAMKDEAVACFDYVARGNRSIVELINSDYTFLNETLAKFYGIADVSGPEMRKVTLPAGDPRGGVLTLGSVLEVTSNPTRTSPVKRGKWILENILGSPAPPPPPDVPALDEAVKKIQGHVPTQREALALHRESPLCASCHARMDPLGLALENFNALGLWRTNESGSVVDASGQLMSGESFQNVSDLKHILADNHRVEFYRTLTEKLLTYALGRGLEYYDMPTVDKIVQRLQSEDGHFSALLLGIIESAPFQQRRLNPNPGATSAMLTPQPSSPDELKLN